MTLVLDMSLDDDLLSKGLARDIIRRFRQRKEMDLRIEAEISLRSLWALIRPSSRRMMGHILSNKATGKLTGDLRAFPNPHSRWME